MYTELLINYTTVVSLQKNIIETETFSVGIHLKIISEIIAIIKKDEVWIRERQISHSLSC